MRNFVLACVFAIMFSNFAFAKSMKITTDELSGKVPANWSVQYDDEDEDGMIIYISSPTFAGDDFQESVSVRREELDTSRKWTSSSALESLLKNMKELHADSFELLSKQKNLAAVRYVHTGINGGTDVVQCLKVIVKKNYVYTICATALPETIQSFEDEFNEIVMSFK